MARPDRPRGSPERKEPADLAESRRSNHLERPARISPLSFFLVGFFRVRRVTHLAVQLLAVHVGIPTILLTSIACSVHSI